MILELYKKSKNKDATHALVIRFAVNRKTFRYPTGFSLTERQWQDEQKNGYPSTMPAVEIEKKALYVLQNFTGAQFDYKAFVRQMSLPIVPRDSITRLWEEYAQHRAALHNNKKIAWRTLELDSSLKAKLYAFLEEALHSNLQQTTTYLQHLPNDEIRIMQNKYEEAIKAVLI